MRSLLIFVNEHQVRPERFLPYQKLQLVELDWFQRL
jgi:hypothetical protein